MGMPQEEAAWFPHKTTNELEVIPMKKRIYRAVAVKDIDLEQLAQRLPSDRIVMGIDVAKKEMYSVLMSPSEEILAVLRWDHLSESRQVVVWLAALPVAVKEAVMEPSSTYGDGLRHCLERSGVPVYQVSPKHVKDSREIYDGVPSSHDAKASAIIAWLHLLGRSSRWEASPQSERELTAGVQRLVLHESAFSSGLNRLEAQLARYWPEVLALLELDAATLLELLARFGSPQQVAACREEAERLMRRVGGPMLLEEKIEQVLASAAETLGVPMVAAERATLLDLASELRRRQKLVRAAKKRVEAQSLGDRATARVGKVVGRVTAAVLTAKLGSLSSYSDVGSLLKGVGLNLKERSSGRRQGELAITKRGSSQPRQCLYLTVLRWIQKDPWAQRWYEQKVQRDGGKKGRALIALMRKLLSGLWWVARGEPFDSTKLFDVRRLGAVSR